MSGPEARGTETTRGSRTTGAETSDAGALDSTTGGATTDRPVPADVSAIRLHPLEGWRVLIPRAPGRGAGLARLVEQAGGSPVVAPLVSRADIGDDDRAVLDAAVAELRDGRVAWVAVTSVNAVDELVASAARVDAAGGDASTGALARVARSARWAAVGPATARALTAVGIAVDLVATENSAVGLLAEWPEVERGPVPPRVLLPLGDLARPTLETGLRERGYEPLRVTTYRTVSHPAPPEVVADWRDGRFDAVVLTSGSVAREVAEQLGPRDDVQAIAIGEPTRRAAVETGQAVAAVARTADDDGLLAALVAARHGNPGASPGVPTGPTTP